MKRNEEAYYAYLYNWVIKNQYFTKARNWRSLTPNLRQRAQTTRGFRDLLRICLISIEAENLESAKRLSEGFILESDVSTPDDREEHKFTIGEIQILENDVFEAGND